jgi:selenide,water dikinase
VTKAVELMVQLNRSAAEVMQAFGASGATDVTGFGLLGHALEMAQASKMGLVIDVPQVPVLQEAREMASMGLVPLGSHANRQFCEKSILIKGEVDTIGYDLLADAQTSGGLLFGLDQKNQEKALARLKDQGIKAKVIGHVTKEHPGQITLAF